MFYVENELLKVM